jgi:ABC-type glycerol-3-phosphate transport system substrate-binding protein
MRGLRTRRGRIGSVAIVAAAAVLAVGAVAATAGGNSTHRSSGKTIVFWHYLTDREQLLQQLADQYKKQTGVTVKLSLLSPDIEAQKFQASVQAHTLPDVVAAWKGPGEDTAPYAKQGIILNLDKAMKSWANRFPPQMLTAASFLPGNTFGVKPGKYLVPLDSNNMQILYNKDLFAKAGIKTPPSTWHDLVGDAQKLRAHGITPFTTGLGSWPVDSLATIYQWNIIGRKDMTATFAGKVPYTSPIWVNFLNFFAGWKNSNLFDQGALGEDLPAAENEFVNGKAAMLFDGSWALGVFHQANPGFTHYGVFMPPPAPKTKNPVYIPGGVGAELFVVGTSPNRDAAVAFVKWLTDAKQQAIYAKTSFNLPANRNVPTTLLSSNKVILDFARRMSQVQPALPNGMPAPVATTMDAGLQRLLAGKSSPQEVAAAMQKALETGQAQ